MLLVVAGDDLNIEVAILTVGSRDPVGIEILDSACLIARSWHTAVVAEFEVAETPDPRNESGLRNLAWGSVRE